MLPRIAGDIIGVSYNQAMKTISYSKNGLDLGIAFRNVCEEELYPTVSPKCAYNTVQYTNAPAKEIYIQE